MGCPSARDYACETPNELWAILQPARSELQCVEAHVLSGCRPTERAAEHRELLQRLLGVAERIHAASRAGSPAVSVRPSAPGACQVPSDGPVCSDRLSTTPGSSPKRSQSRSPSSQGLASPCRSVEHLEAEPVAAASEEHPRLSHADLTNSSLSSDIRFLNTACGSRSVAAPVTPRMRDSRVLPVERQWASPVLASSARGRDVTHPTKYDAEPVSFRRHVSVPSVEVRRAVSPSFDAMAHTSTPARWAATCVPQECHRSPCASPRPLSRPSQASRPTSLTRQTLGSCQPSRGASPLPSQRRSLPRTSTERGLPLGEPTPSVAPPAGVRTPGAWRSQTPTLRSQYLRSALQLPAPGAVAPFSESRRASMGSLRTVAPESMGAALLGRAAASRPTSAVRGAPPYNTRALSPAWR